MDTKAVNKEFMRQEMSAAGMKGLLKITALIGRVQEFLADSYNRFTAEGE